MVPLAFLAFLGFLQPLLMLFSHPLLTTMKTILPQWTQPWWPPLTFFLAAALADQSHHLTTMRTILPKWTQPHLAFTQLSL
jgi:hypothetical protein